MINRSGSLPSSYKVLAFIAVVTTFFIRPFAMGLEYSIPGYIICAIIGLMVFNSLPHTTKNASKIYVAILITYVIATLFTTIDLRDFITRIGGSTIAYLLCANQKFLQTYFRYFINAMIFICACAIGNFILEIFFPIESLQICHIDFPEDQYEYYLSYPFSLSKMMLRFDYSVEGILSFLIGEHQRQYLFFVEPGMAPPFIMSIACILYYNRTKHFPLKIAVLIIALFFTFSTTGVLVFMAAILIYYFFMHKKKFSIKYIITYAVMTVGALYGYLYMPIFGRNAKLDSSAAISVETHENVVGYVLVGMIFLVPLCLYLRRLKRNPSLFIIIACLLLIGYMANYIAFTFAFTMFLFYDQEVVGYYAEETKLKG